MARPSLLWDINPDLLDKIIEYMALGLPSREIAQSLGVNDSTVRKWKTRKDISQLLAIKTLETLAEPAKHLAKVNPGLFLQTHPATRESHAPPKQVQENTGSVEIVIRDCVKTSD